MNLKKITSQVIINQKKVNSISNIIAIASGKGGVGKSTIAANLAVSLAKHGNKIGLIDADIYGPTQTKLFAANEQKLTFDTDNKLSPLPSQGIKLIAINHLIDCSKPLIFRAPIIIKLIQTLLHNVAWGELDYLLIDLPPGTGDIPLTIAQQLKLTGAIIITTPQEIALNIAQKSLQMLQQLNVPILGIIENMSGFVCQHCQQITQIFPNYNTTDIFKLDNIQLLAKVPLQPEIASASDIGKPIATLTNETIFYNLSQKIITIIQDLQTSSAEPLTIELVDNKLIILFDTNFKQIISAYALRIQCHCALCMDTNTQKSLLNQVNIPLDIQILDFKQVGHYGLKITFSDGHNTGIYTFASLRKF